MQMKLTPLGGSRDAERSLQLLGAVNGKSNYTVQRTAQIISFNLTVCIPSKQANPARSPD